jgi:hypothetical protein
VIPDVPHFEDIYGAVGTYADKRPLNEIEAITIEMLLRLHGNPVNKDTLRNQLGVGKTAFETTLDIGLASGLIIDQRARGRNILASPLYFSGNLDGLIDIAGAWRYPGSSQTTDVSTPEPGHANVDDCEPVAHRRYVHLD